MARIAGHAWNSLAPVGVIEESDAGQAWQLGSPPLRSLGAAEAGSQIANEQGLYTLRSQNIGACLPVWAGAGFVLGAAAEAHGLLH